jgi:stage II sporulation protein AA (anti-sigma F factor antagonist)
VSAPFTIDAAIHDGQAYLTLTGDVNLEVKRPVRDRVQLYLQSDAVRGIVVNLAAATFIDSNGLGVLLACRRRAIAAHKTFRVSATSPRVASILEPTGVLRLLQGLATAVYLSQP